MRSMRLSMALFLDLARSAYRSMNSCAASLPFTNFCRPIPCLDLGDGELRGLSGLDLPNVDAVKSAKGWHFTSESAGAIEKNPRYQTFAIKGIDQPTSPIGAASRRKSRTLVQLQREGLRRRRDRAATLVASARVAGRSQHRLTSRKNTPMLQSTNSILTQVFGLLTGQLGKFMGGARIGVDMPTWCKLAHLYRSRRYRKDGDPSLPLHVVCDGEDGQKHWQSRFSCDATGDGRYHAKIDGLPEGAWRSHGPVSNAGAAGRTSIRLGSGLEIRTGADAVRSEALIVAQTSCEQWEPLPQAAQAARDCRSAEKHGYALGHPDLLDGGDKRISNGNARLVRRMCRATLVWSCSGQVTEAPTAGIICLSQLAAYWSSPPSTQSMLAAWPRHRELQGRQNSRDLGHLLFGTGGGEIASAFSSVLATRAPIRDANGLLL